ncbi:hypothetical protein HPB48_024421 [Haemaphysalis longicornis]|uniref:Tick transposon n=1 Tax=Haemaphysalis longicornis TaxID=44386 RepID=A0A9J6H957_HAELO|nr:hypothetical protein HPB48_024421 [Haemaphysalis longicornis]
MEVIRSLWKAAMVPGLTYAGAVLCPSAATKEYLERRQREVGRLALGSHRTTPNEAVQGDMGWSSFAAREATAKLSFEMRAWTLGETNWVYRVRRSLLFTARSTRWTKRVRALSEKYGVPLPALCNLKDTTMTRAKVRERVSQVETQQWAGRAAAKPALHFYVAHKREIRCEGFYDNASGSGLLFEARSGTLRTRRWQVSCGTAESAICELCGEEEESIEHVVLYCPRLEPPYFDSGNILLTAHEIEPAFRNLSLAKTTIKDTLSHSFMWLWNCE